jgi:hypothetical protein
MKRSEKLKLIGIPLVGALVIYFGGYFTVEHLRHRKGSWQVEFFATNRTPAVRIDQPHLGISNVVLILEQEASAPSFTNSTWSFVDPSNTPYPVPHGRVIFEDLTFLPGTVTFDFNGHGVELLPRTLIVNGREHAWQSGATLSLQPADKKHPVTPAEYQERLKASKKDP